MNYNYPNCMHAIDSTYCITSYPIALTIVSIIILLIIIYYLYKSIERREK